MSAADTTGLWLADWLWGLLLVAVSLVDTRPAGLIGVSLARWFGWLTQSAQHSRGSFVLFPTVIGVASLLLAVLHGLEASIWAASYVWLGASPDFPRAIYFSLQMITTLGADIVVMDRHWKLMGPLEAIAGILLFGLSTAFLFAILQRVWPFASPTEANDQGREPR